MKFKICFFTKVFLLYAILFSAPQSFIAYGQNHSVGYIIEKKESRIYTDLGSKITKVGDRFKVIKEGGVFTHPVNGTKIKEEDEIIWIDIIDVKNDYSVATTKNKSLYDLVKVGMTIYLPDSIDVKSSSYLKSIVVQPLSVTNVYGYLGLYISDVLEGELLSSNRFRVLDRNSLGIDNKELLESANGLLAENDFISSSNLSSTDYIITGTMYEPDVVEISTGVPVKSIVQLVGLAIGSVSRQDISSFLYATEYLPDKTEIKKLRAVVNISLKLIDAKTGDILFICSEMQEAVGQSEINLEGGFLNGLKVKGGSSSFGNTVSGEATQKCLKNLLNYIFQFLDGNIKSKNYVGNIITLSNNANVSAANVQVGKPILFHYSPSEHQFLIGVIKRLENYGRIYYEYASNGQLKSDYASKYDFIILEDNKIYKKVENFDELDKGDFIFMHLSNRIRFGNFESQRDSELINYSYYDWVGKLTYDQILLDNVYSVKPGISYYPYTHSVSIDSTYYYFYEHDLSLKKVQVSKLIYVNVISMIEFIGKRKHIQSLICNNKDLYPINGSFHDFMINNWVYFIDSEKKIIYGIIIGFNPFDETLIILSNNIQYIINYKLVNKVK